MRLMIALALSLVLIDTATAADPPRKIDFTQVLKDQDGDDVFECVDAADKECKEKRSVTLGMVANKALSMPEQNLGLDESYRRGRLANQVYKATAAPLAVEEIALIKKLIARSYGPMIVFRAVQILDPPTD